MSDPASTIFPIGHYLGEKHPEGHHLVRLGRQHRKLSPEEFGLRALAHGLPAVGRHPWTVAHVHAFPATSGLPPIEPVLREMTGSGLLCTIGPEAAAAQQFVRSHRLDPLLLELGISAHDQQRHRVGWPGTQTVVDSSSYELWQWGHVTPSLWDTLVLRETVSAAIGEQSTTDALIEVLLADLRELLANSCAYLDLARR